MPRRVLAPTTKPSQYPDCEWMNLAVASRNSFMSKRGKTDDSSRLDGEGGNIGSSDIDSSDTDSRPLTKQLSSHSCNRTGAVGGDGVMKKATVHKKKKKTGAKLGRKRGRGKLKKNVKWMSFVERVYVMLQDAEAESFEDVIQWEPDGKSFKVHRARDFEENIQPCYLNQTKLRSFQRKLIAHGFSSIQGGPSRGAYRHSKFVKGELAMCLQIARENSTGLGPGSDGDDGSASDQHCYLPLLSAVSAIPSYLGAPGFLEAALGPVMSPHFMNAARESRPSWPVKRTSEKGSENEYDARFADRPPPGEQHQTRKKSATSSSQNLSIRQMDQNKMLIHRNDRNILGLGEGGAVPVPPPEDADPSGRGIVDRGVVLPIETGGPRIYSLATTRSSGSMALSVPPLSIDKLNPRSLHDAGSAGTSLLDMKNPWQPMDPGPTATRKGDNLHDDFLTRISSILTSSFSTPPSVTAQSSSAVVAIRRGHDSTHFSHEALPPSIGMLAGGRRRSSVSMKPLSASIFDIEEEEEEGQNIGRNVGGEMAGADDDQFSSALENILDECIQNLSPSSDPFSPRPILGGAGDDHTTTPEHSRGRNAPLLSLRRNNSNDSHSSRNSSMHQENDTNERSALGRGFM